VRREGDGEGEGDGKAAMREKPCVTCCSFSHGQFVLGHRPAEHLEWCSDPKVSPSMTYFLLTRKTKTF
jgi:hypothetical protein